MGYLDTKKDFVTMNLDEMRKPSFLSEILERQKTNKEYVDLGEGWKDREHCPICHGTDKSYQFSKFDIELYQCNTCKTGFFNKVPKNTNDVYSAPKALKFSKDGYMANKDYRMVRFAKERIQLIEKLTNKQMKELSILDVGCGSGWFLEEAKNNGANCYGLELGKDLAAFTAERLDINVWNCDLLELDTEVKVDVVTMFDLIEHVEDPVQLVKKAKSLLKENGIIVIFTPQFDSVAIQALKDYSNLIMPAEHLSYFTYESVVKLCELTNTELVSYETKGIDIGDLMGYENYLGNLERANFFKESYDLLQPTIDASNSGNHLRAILKLPKK